jgi:carbamoyltransferase
MKLPSIPNDSILGINYSGMHDTSFSIVRIDGEILFSSSLERFTRVKQDGRFLPEEILNSIPWKNISQIAIATDGEFHKLENYNCQTITGKLPERTFNPSSFEHNSKFYLLLKNLPIEPKFVCHQMAHAASAIRTSGMTEGFCITYDGGMANCNKFGGIFRFNTDHKITIEELFSSEHYARLTGIYTFITALLGFTPNKHEGKITGLAAHGKFNQQLYGLIHDLFYLDFRKIDDALVWINTNEQDLIPQLIENNGTLADSQNEFSIFSKEDIAHAVQFFIEKEFCQILDKFQKIYHHNGNICFAGGLFSNVKLNYEISKFSFENIFIAPFMSDDGAGLGAALSLVNWSNNSKRNKLDNLFLGGFEENADVIKFLESNKIAYTEYDDLVLRISRQLDQGKILGFFNGRAEFGPRALGNRSILASAKNLTINQKLNDLLLRTEFMPFAPIVKEEDADQLFTNIDNTKQNMYFMTTAVECLDALAINSPAVVHVDKTARPQLISKNLQPFLHNILNEYEKISGQKALINTSFNVHEEPIVNNLEDALRGFFESGLDWLVINERFVIDVDKNLDHVLKYLQENRKKNSLMNKLLKEKIEYLKIKSYEKSLKA